MSKIQYISTRGTGDPKNFLDVLMEGMAPDGGLYIPDLWPEFDHKLISHMSGLGYADIAAQIMSAFVGDSIPKADFCRLVDQVYSGSSFDHKAIAPLSQLGPNAWLLELYHGPTLSFKDYALQFLGALFDYVLEKNKKKITIIGATSGDTGSAAIEACRHCKNIEIYILHPKGRTSEFQRRQMTTVDSPNVHNIAIEGSFDDCQAIVKTLFADKALNEKLDITAVNSINWARIMAQTVYYYTAAIALGAPNRQVSFVVPTGNFGNVYAGWVAKRTGLPVNKLTIATNRNDILTRFFDTGQMKTEKVMPSLSPSMDIQVSSNFERYLCEIMERDHGALTKLMQSFKTGGSFKIAEKLMTAARSDFHAVRCSDIQTIDSMKECFKATGRLIDPHTAVALHAAMNGTSDPSTPSIILSCAHPAKFSDAVTQATGISPELPPEFVDLLTSKEYFETLPNNPQEVKSYILSGK
jgi:threonine synthase